MMRQMRENTKWIMLVTALAFVLLMVFEWGMDITGRSAGTLGEIGRVDRTPVYYEDYMLTYRSLYDQVGSAQDEPVTSQQNRDIEQAAWDQLVNQILVRQELDRRGIRVTDDEILSAARIAPPPLFQNSPEFQTDGEFDLEKYQAFIQSPQIDEGTLLYLEQYYREIIPRGKLLRQITSGMFLTDAELWQQWRDRSETVQVRYVALDPYQRTEDASVDITDDEIGAYYRENESDFEVAARAAVKVVALRKAPTAADSVATRERALALREEILAGADFAEVASRESSDQLSAASGGELGTFPRGRMTAAFEETAFSAPLGEITEPVETEFGLHVIEVNRRTADSVNARHILVEFERTDESEIALLTMADSLEDLSERIGLDAAATAIGLESQEIELNSAFPFIAGVGQTGEGADWATEEASPGDVSPVFETPDAFYGLELISATPAGVLPLEESRSNIEQILIARKKIARGLEESQGLVEEIRAGSSLADVAAAHGLEAAAAGPFSRYDFVPGLGRQNAAIGAAFGLRPGEVSDPISTDANVFVIEQIALTRADSTQWLDQRTIQAMQLMSGLERERLDLWLQGLRERADIVDRREIVLQPAEEQPLRPTGGLF